VAQLLLVNSLADYLPEVGPSPLRYRSAAALTAGAEFPQAPEVAGTTNVPAKASIASHEAAASTTASLPAPVILEAKSPDPLDPFEYFSDMAALSHGGMESNFITPQMLVPFFQRRSGGTNSMETGVLGSVLFSPPRPATNVTSKAAYATP
jgi:hypothetical protein